MKKIFKLILVLASILVVGIKGVKAETVNVTQQFIDNVWSFHYRNGSVWTFGNLPYNYANGHLIYCIQPDARITTNNYNVYSDFTLSGYSNEDREKMELISYYGYGYSGHSSLKYYMATQELLWLFSSDESIKWTTGNTDDTPEIDVSAEKNEILRLVSQHNILPSFVNSSNTAVVGEFIELTDSNNVINNYSIVGSNFTYGNSSNKLRIRLNKPGVYTFRFEAKPNYNRSETYIYDDFSTRTQTLAMFKTPNLVSGSFTISALDVKVEINKKDIDTNELIMKDGIKIKIKNKETNKYIGEEYEFKNGKVNLTLPIGKYIIEEISTVEPYSLNNENLEFEITENDSSKNVDFYNKKVTGKINITKTNEENENLNGVEFEVYDENNNLVDTLVTDKGKAESKELPLGKYTVKETKELYGYEKDDKLYEVNLTYENQNKKIVNENVNIVNKKIKCLITYITVSGKEGIDASFNIYNKEGTLVYSGKTIDGKAEIELPYDDYIIKEISVPNGYILNDKEISFSVNDKICQSTMSVNNEKVTMPITTKENNMIYMLIFLINFACYEFIKKNS